MKRVQSSYNKPAPGYRIDWGNVVTRNLVVCHTFPALHASKSFDLVSGQIMVINSAATISNLGYQSIVSAGIGFSTDGAEMNNLKGKATALNTNSDLTIIFGSSIDTYSEASLITLSDSTASGLGIRTAIS